MRRLAAALILLGGCVAGLEDPCFDPAGIVGDDRVISVRADPPESVWEPGDPPPQVRLRALIAQVRPGAVPVDLSVRLCTSADLSVCTDGNSLSTDTDRLDISVTIPPEIIEGAREADALHGFDGVRVHAALSIGTLSTIKQLIVSPHGTIPNGPVEITGIEIGGPGRDTKVLQSDDYIIGYVPDGVIPVERRPDVVYVRPILGEGSVEDYDVIDMTGTRRHLRERIVYSFYSNKGLFFGDPLYRDANGGFRHIIDGSDGATEPDLGMPIPPYGLVRLYALKYNHHGRVWVVARDGRGAEAWAWLNVDAHDERCCCPLGGCDAYPNCQGLGPDESGCPWPIEPVCAQPQPPICLKKPCTPPPDG